MSDNHFVLPKIIPEKQGLGFWASVEIKYPGLRVEPFQQGFNHFLTSTNIDLPWNAIFGDSGFRGQQITYIDGFSPNLNKSLHVGHLRNLILGATLSRIFDATPVALLGASQGIVGDAPQKYGEWCYKASYEPCVTLDLLLPMEIAMLGLGGPILEEVIDPENSYFGCKTLPGKDGKPVVVIRSNGEPTYAYHDLLLDCILKRRDQADLCLRVCGEEQTYHFSQLSMPHVPVSMVLGEDGKKLSSRNGDTMSTEELLQTVKARLEADRSSPEISEDLAWNILSYNFLSRANHTPIKFDLGLLTARSNPAYKITYALARFRKIGETYNDGLDIKGTGSLEYSDYLLFLRDFSLEQTKIQGNTSSFAAVMLKIADYLNSLYVKYHPFSEHLPAFAEYYFAAQILEEMFDTFGMKVVEEM